MKILACADLHVEAARIEEYRAALEAVAEDAAMWRPDLAVVAGDLCGRHVPHRPAPAERNLVAEFVARLADNAGHVAVVRGNHDSPDEWRWLEHLRGSVSWSTAPEVLDGEGWHLVALPALDRGQVKGANHAAGVVAAYAPLLADPPGEPGSVRVVVAHAPIDGALGLPDAALYRLPAEAVIPPWADVVILGDNHTLQAVTERARYTGALLPGAHGETGPWGWLRWSNEGRGPAFKVWQTPGAKLRAVIECNAEGRALRVRPDLPGLHLGAPLADSADWPGWRTVGSLVVTLAAADADSGGRLAQAIRAAIRPMVDALEVRVTLPRRAPTARTEADEVVGADGLDAQVAAFAAQHKAPEPVTARAVELLAGAVEAGVANG